MCRKRLQGKKLSRRQGSRCLRQKKSAECVFSIARCLYRTARIAQMRSNRTQRKARNTPNNTFIRYGKLIIALFLQITSIFVTFLLIFRQIYIIFS